MNELIIPPMRQQIFAIEAEIKKLPQLEIPVRHIFSDGIYAREISVPALSLITGVIHKYPQLNILSKGHIRVSVDEDIREIEAPFMIASPAGVKRIAFTITDVVWVTVIHTFLTCVDEIEKKFFAHSEQEYQDFVKEQTEQYEWLA